MKLRIFWIVLLMLVLVPLAVYGGYRLAFRGTILPRISIGGVGVTGLSKSEATSLVGSVFARKPSKVTLWYDGKEVTNFDKFNVEYDPIWAVDQAYMTGRGGNILTQFTEQFRTVFETRNINVPIAYDKDELEGLVNKVNEKIGREPVWPTLVINEGRVELKEGKSGINVKTEELKMRITENLASPGVHRLEVPIEITGGQIDSEQVQKAILAANKWLDNKLTLSGNGFHIDLDRTRIFELIGLGNEQINPQGFEKLVKEIQPNIETDSKDAVLTFENGKAKEFKPEIVGAKLDVPSLKLKLAENIYQGKTDLNIPLILTYPKVRAGDINDMGIKELIGEGTSSFSHSIPGRVFNVNLAASRINGVVISPGEEFSFGLAVGDISHATGYLPAYIISGGKTVLGDGGGVCQVSTTVFRAALKAGLPITEREAHAYRVGYYEQDSKPGIDATVFYPTADLKFKNDTGHHILIMTTVDTKNLTMKVDFYGTSDGRKATLSEPIISSQTPPPPTLYIDDPTLPVNTMKQIDWSAWGAKVSFDYKVERGGETLIEKTFFSNYQPWQAIYMRGTKV